MTLLLQIYTSHPEQEGIKPNQLNQVPTLSTTKGEGISLLTLSSAINVSILLKL